MLSIQIALRPCRVLSRGCFRSVFTSQKVPLKFGTGGALLPPTMALRGLGKGTRLFSTELVAQSITPMLSRPPKASQVEQP